MTSDLVGLRRRSNPAEQPLLEAWIHRVGAERVLEAALSLQGEAAFAVDEERRVVLWTDGAERLLGFHAEDVLGEHCLKSSRCSQCMQGCGIAEHGTIRDVPLAMYAADGAEVAVAKEGRAFFDEDGTFLGGIEILRPRVESGADKPADPPRPPAPPALLGSTQTFHGILTRDSRMLDVLDVVKNVADSDVTVLIRGESGTGKELVARALHEESHRREAPFVAINCAALSPSLLESEMFGHEKGSFTGAVREHRGVFEQADGGTLFLDEVAELPLELQAKLLRVLQERTFTRVGGTRPIKVDVRVVSATHRSLRDLVSVGKFREDLMYRLRVVPVFLPPLRDRRVDIALLVDHLLERLNARGRRQVHRVAPEAMRALLDHPWPGNVREMMNVLEYAFAVGRGPEIRLEDLPPEFRNEGPVLSPGPRLPPALPGGRYRPPANEEEEAEAIRRALEDAGGHIGHAAKLLGMSRPTLWRRRAKYGI